tara:strand:+ start:154 stop:2736 length:2583 start_codon:yes stop_codon:yes gene_type:complete
MNYHTFSRKEVIEELDSSIEGLSKGEVSNRLKKYGFNKLKKVKRFNALKVFLEQFKSFLIIILIFAAILSIFMKSVIDSVIIFAILLINAGIGFFQEYKAEKAIEELKKLMVPKTRVFRNGKVMNINSYEVVPGDILVLREGDKIVADARILKLDGLKVNEAALTGESVPENKIHSKISDSLPLVDRVNMVYQGTQVIVGSGRAIVIATGMNTELGKISELVQKTESEKNPFKQRLDSFAKKIGIFILILSALVVGLLILIEANVFDSLLVAVSLAVSAIPEGLPAVISLGFAFATRRMLRSKILVRKLPASETLGRTTVICTDKTGTLTEEEMRVVSIYSDGRLNPAKNKDLLLRIGVLCNKARIEKNDFDKYYFIGDPTETALIVSAKDNFLDKKELTEKEPKIKEFAFSSERKMMSVVRQRNEIPISYVKGAPEKIISKSNYELINNTEVRLSDKRKEELIKEYEKMAKKGLRVLGFAYKELKGLKITQQSAEKELVFVGFQGMIDPPRREVKNAITLCKNAGIKVIMITGDSRLTAEAVANKIGLVGRSIESKELATMSDSELLKKIDDVSVFSRISPEDKLRIINILKQKNEIVAMTGDGVNDAPALKRADIGISMGIRGTDVARDSSDIILLDDNFASIVEGVKEGRTIYDNIQKFIKFLLSANFSEMALIILVILIWRNPELLPLLPLQILWINLVTDGLPALALSAEPMEKDVMQRKPNKKGILSGIKLFIFVASLFSFLVYFLFFYLNMENIVMARTIIVTFAVMFQMVLVFNCKTNKSILKSPMNKQLIYAVLISVVLHLIVLYTPIRTLFGFVSLGVFDWIKLLSLCLFGFIFIEVFKFFDRKRVLTSY